MRITSPCPRARRSDPHLYAGAAIVRHPVLSPTTGTCSLELQGSEDADWLGLLTSVLMLEVELALVLSLNMFWALLCMAWRLAADDLELPIL